MVLHLLAAWLLSFERVSTPPLVAPRVVEISLLTAPAQSPEPALPALAREDIPSAPPPASAAAEPQRPALPRPATAKPAEPRTTQKRIAQIRRAPRDAAAPGAPPTAVSTRVAQAPAAPVPAASSEPEPTAPRFDAAYLDNPPPAYPPLSRRLGEQGRVLVRVFVEPGGSPAQVELRASSGHRRLDAAAVAAVRRWRFVPARRGAEPVGAWVLVPITFNLRS
jgi:TonB family C-terminal domain